MRTAPRPRVLFLCVENSCRSQLAEALGRLAGLDASSAGSRPSGRVHPGAIATMAELGYDLSTHASKSIDRFTGTRFDATVTMGCGDDCADLHADCRETWPIPDPKDADAAGFARVRDDSAQRVTRLASRLADERTAGG